MLVFSKCILLIYMHVEDYLALTICLHIYKWGCLTKRGGGGLAEKILFKMRSSKYRDNRSAVSGLHPTADERHSRGQRSAPTRCLKIDVFFSLVHWNTLCTIIICAVLIVMVNNVLFLIDYITITYLSACFYVGLLWIFSASTPRPI